MKARIMMIIMAVALVALPTMAQQEWQSTSAMQGSGSAYGAQVTAVGAAGVTDMATTTTSTPNNGPRRAKKDEGGSDFGPGGQTGGYQDPNSPIGDAWPLALFAALFAIVITIKKHKKVMKKNLKTWLVIAIALLTSNSALAVDMPDGTYYFDLSAFTGAEQAWEIQVFNNISSESYIGFTTDSTCNTGLSQGASRKIYMNTSTGFNQLVLTINTPFSNSGGFIQVRYGATNATNAWAGWHDYSAPTAIGGKKVYVCKVTKSSITWGTTSSDLPSCAGGAGGVVANPTLNFSAGANGSITTATAGGEDVGDGDKVAAGTSVNLVATPNSGYVFVGWSDENSDIVDTNADYTFTMPSSSVTLTALFAVKTSDPSISGCAGCFKVAP